MKVGTNNMKTKISDLRYGMTEIKPVHFDWSEGYLDKWDYFAASRCEECGEVLVGRNGDTHESLAANNGQDCECRGHVPENDGPMMSYYYPLPDFNGNEDSARALVDLPLVLVRFEESGDWALALSGGGMDLSWEICAGFMALGYLPPVHFSDLPKMAGRGQSPSDRAIIAACRKSVQSQKHSAGRVLRRLRESFTRA